MSNAHAPTSIPVTIRVYPEPPKEGKARGQIKSIRPDTMIVFDTETTTDPTQRLLFDSYRFMENGICIEEGLFHAPDLSTDQRKKLRQYVVRNFADTDNREFLRLITLNHFLDKLFKAAYKGRTLVVGFNLPFDLSRLAFNVTPARREFGGGFSLGLWTYTDKKGVVRLDPNRPRITIKHIDSKRSLISFTGRKSPDEVDLIPEGSLDGKPRHGYKFRGHFLDLKTLAFALTDRSHALKSACEAFGVKRGKIEAEKHGEVTDEYIDYNRRDVEATAELALALLAEFDRHPIGCDAQRFHMIAHYQTDPRKWVQSNWINQYSGKCHSITTDKECQDWRTAWVKTYGDVVTEYAYHPESKCADRDGNSAGPRAIGLLFRRHVRIGQIVPIGKESNSLEEVDAGTVHSPDQVYTVYPDPSRDFWTRQNRALAEECPIGNPDAENRILAQDADQCTNG